jgi:hypothetical protein
MSHGVWNRVVGVCMVAATSAATVAVTVAVTVASSGAVAEGSAAGVGTSSVADARRFLYRMMDLHAVGTVPRLVQSFTGGPLGRTHFTDSETYDDALVMDALLADGTSASRVRARTIANALLFVQHNDPAHDGRIRVAYAPNPLRSRSDIKITDRTSDVGNMAWAAMALARLAAVTHRARYLTGAVAIGAWIVRHCRDTRGAGGFTGGYAASGRRLTWKSTEHNLDLYALYRMLAKQTREHKWAREASWARGFVVAMWRPNRRDFAVGTGNDGRTVNHDEQPEDVNSWSYLALQDPRYQASIGWDVAHLSVSGAGFAGVSFCRGDKSGAWYEGTAHLADALKLRGGRGDHARAVRYLADIRAAQRNGPNTDRLGIIAASKNKLSDCDGDFYYRSLHTGATAWYILARRGVDPFSPA